MRTRSKLATLVVLGVLFFSQAPPAQACHGLFCHGRCGGVMYYSGGGVAPSAGGGFGQGYVPYWNGGGTGFGFNPYLNTGGTGFGFNPYLNTGGTGFGFNPYLNNGGTGFGYGAGTGYSYQGVNPGGIGQGLIPGNIGQDIQQAAAIFSRLLGVIGGGGQGPGPSGQLPGGGFPSTSGGQSIRIDLYVHQVSPGTSTTPAGSTTPPTLDSRVSALEGNVGSIQNTLADIQKTLAAAKAAGKL